MVIQNSILVLNNLCVANIAKQGRDAVVGKLGHSMPEAMSQGRPMSPRFTTYEPTDLAKAKRVGRCVASLPGNSLQAHGWRKSGVWVSRTRAGITASSLSATGRGLSNWGARHQQTSGHDYPSHDRRDDRQRNRHGYARTTDSGK